MLDQRRTDSTWPADISSFCFEVPYSENSILFESGKGVRLFDAAGRGYLDAMSGVFVTCFGYDCQPIIKAMTEQLQKMAFNPPLHGTNRVALALADALVDLAPPGIRAAKLVSGGSESIETAAKLARFYHRLQGAAGKVKILSYYHGYHGSTFGALSLTGVPGVSSMFGPPLPNVVHVWPPDCFESFWDVPAKESGALAASMLERTIEAEGPDSVAALIIEPVIQQRAMAIPTPEYLARIREICDRHDILLIFDEIVTGFGRTGQPFAAQTFGVTPDLLCTGKGISGGYSPLAAVLIHERVAQALGVASGSLTFGPTHTYSANPLSSAAGLASVTHFRQGGFTDVVQRLAALLHPRLEQAVGERGTVRSVGLLFGIKLSDPEGRDVGALVSQACLRRGLILRGQDDWIVLAPAFVTSETDVEEICLTLTDALEEVYGTG
ncbi:aspartate aminotransferase family protein [Streptosporangium carneum]|uniref:Aspartate aminotransferase family protein n=1 Tax=Streptosporangium carneum TaxID=47481 RepID=A0A9W6HXT4_9ACTN|nr:aminotransferase class III-fold pyridoxal phosphate-dependent enzyme [Streptosporangium carneum]GLK08297.1 aspartate aminotransferase family protein [Streptosporangium carneum]